MDLHTPISEIMTRQVHSVDEGKTLFDVIAMLKKHRIRHIPVVKSGKVTGMLSRTDINRLTFGDMFDAQEDADETVLEMLTIPQVMTGNPKTVEPSATLEEVARIFTQQEFHALPVATNGDLEGIITTTDVIKALLK